jgi:hypothetical protein
MAGNRHRHILRDSRPHKVAHSGASQVVKQTSRDVGHATSRAPRLSELANRLALTVKN